MSQMIRYGDVIISISSKDSRELKNSRYNGISRVLLYAGSVNYGTLLDMLEMIRICLPLQKKNHFVTLYSWQIELICLNLR